MEDIKSDRDKIQRIRSIIEREIEKELVSKQNEVSDITEKIKIVLRNLDILKYIAAVNYYDSNTALTQKKTQDDENEDEKVQTQIHPCIKKLLPFRSNYNKSFGDYLSTHSYETRNSRKTNELATVTVKKDVDSDTNQEKCVSSSNNMKIPQYIPPLPSDRNVKTPSRGNVSREHYRIVVGNISKWIPPDMREDNSTHKWMVYIRNKENSKDVTKLLRKVRYFLHESYKPHDIIDVTSDPFHLTRRGWGEFPIRVQLHFVHPLDKPVDVIHNLKLDMTCSGIQMLGAETVIDVSLHGSNTSGSEKNGNLKTEPNTKVETMRMGDSEREKQDIYDGSLLTSINGMKPVNCFPPIKTEEKIDCDIKIKQEPDDEYENENLLSTKMEEINLAISNNKKFLLDRRKIMKIIEIEHDYLRNDESELEKPFATFANSILKLEGVKSQNGGEKTCKNGAVLNAVQLNQIIKRRQQQGGFNKMELWRNKSEEEIFSNLKSAASNMETDSQSRYSTKVFRHLYLVNILERAHATKLKTVESLLKWFVQRWPIVTRLSLDPTYKNLHPYSCPSEEEFFNYNIGKQRSAEWFRAKAIQKVLTSLKTVIPIDEDIWSTKQILLWSRFHGYSPASFHKTVDRSLEEARECQSKRLKSNESSSDSEDGISDNSSKRLRTGDDKYLNGLNIGEKKKNFKKSRRKEVIQRTIERHKNYKELNTYSPADEDNDRFGSNEFRVLAPGSATNEIEIVEVETNSVQESPSKKREVKLEVTTIPTDEVLFNKFVCETVRQIGVKVSEEEIIPGVNCDSVSRVLTQCAFSFVEELLRRSYAHAWLRCGDRCPDFLEANDVLGTLIEHPQFDIFTNRGLGVAKPEKSGP